MFKKLWQSLFPKKQKPIVDKIEQSKEIIPEVTVEEIQPPAIPIPAPEPFKPVYKPESVKQQAKTIRSFTSNLLSKPREYKRKGIQQIICWDESAFPFRWRVKTIRHA